jgi:hypothetical protein
LPDSLPPAVSTRRAPPKRPLYLVIALLLVWVLGLFGAVQGCNTIEVLHEPDAMRAAAGRLSNPQAIKQTEEQIETVLQFRNIVTPLAVGQLLLASVLTLTAGLSLIGRSTARRIALQAMAAYAIFLPLDYVTRSPMRAAVIETLARTVSLTPLSGIDPPAELSDPRVAHLWFQWLFRVVLGAQLSIVAIGMLALTRPRARAFFGAVADRTRELEP